MRIAVVCPYDLEKPGGVQQIAIELVDRLVDRGHDAWLVGPGHRPGAVEVGRTFRVRANDSVAPVALGPRVPAKVREAVRGADVVHVHEPIMPLVSTAALRGSAPRVVTFHADAPKWASRLYRRLPNRWVEAIATAVVTAVSPVAAAALPEEFGEPEIIPNGLDTSAFRSKPKVPFRVTFLGRDEPRKGLDLLLAAWPTIRRRIPEAELVVMGADRAHVPEGVRCLGRVDEETKREMLGSASVHVAPNTGGESFGIVVAEAMAAGCAVVASDIPAFRAVLSGAGVLVPVGDVGALAAEIAGLLATPAEIDASGRSARARAADFDWSVVVDRYLRAYERARG